MANVNMTYHFYATPAGMLKVGMRQHTICEAVFVDEASEVLKPVQDITCIQKAALDIQGTAFQKKVWQAALEIPAGTTLTYQEVAQKIGNPRAYRAVGTALGRNKILYLIPCHRVIQKSGKLGGYSGGSLARKAALLHAERL